MLPDGNVRWSIVSYAFSAFCFEASRLRTCRPELAHIWLIICGTTVYAQTSTAPNSMQDEWASEAVQLGGVGSAMGSLGMWTGAFHEDGDPLGTCSPFLLYVFCCAYSEVARCYVAVACGMTATCPPILVMSDERFELRISAAPSDDRVVSLLTIYPTDSVGWASKPSLQEVVRAFCRSSVCAPAGVTETSSWVRKPGDTTLLHTIYKDQGCRVSAYIRTSGQYIPDIVQRTSSGDRRECFDGRLSSVPAISYNMS